jgi:hypothetical protein
MQALIAGMEREISWLTRDRLRIQSRPDDRRAKRTGESRLKCQMQKISLFRSGVHAESPPSLTDMHNKIVIAQSALSKTGSNRLLTVAAVEGVMGKQEDSGSHMREARGVKK